MVNSIRLIHWNETEAAQRAERLRALGYDVNAAPPNGPDLMKELAHEPPLALVVDLSRLPSQGRDVGVSLRQRKSTRHLPLVFVGGEPEKVARIQKLLPDAVYAEWDSIGEALPEAIAHPPQNPVAMDSVFAAYAGRPLAAKLGIREGTATGLIRPFDGLIDLLGQLPPTTQVRDVLAPDPSLDVTVWFVRSTAELEAEMASMAAALTRGALWIAWEKAARGRVATGRARRSSGKPSDDQTEPGKPPDPITGQQQVRDLGLAAGLVDFKVCAIDETWTALCFARRGVRS
jgi:hypothetical protein